MKYTKSFDVDKYDRNRKLIVYGASSYGELAYYMLKKIGITPDFYCDRAFPEDRYMGIAVIRPNEIEKYKDECFLIASADYFYEIYRFLDQKGVSEIYDLGKMFNEIDVEPDQLTKRARDMLMNKQNYIDVIYQTQGSNTVNFTRIQYVVSERCSLKCRDCTHLMQYYEHPKNIELEKYKPAFDRLLSVTNTISEIRILGGEPFMNPEMYKIINWYVAEDRINSFRVYTNGTIIPNERILDSLMNDKVQVRISDYGFNTESIKKLKEVLDKREISYYITPYSDWQDPGDLHFRNHTIEKMKTIFSNCYERNCITFFRGLLHRCPRSAHAMNLGAMPNTDKDYIDLLNWSDTKHALKCRIDAFQKLDYLETCNYCDGPNRNLQHIPAAIQIDKPRHYEKINYMR